MMCIGIDQGLALGAGTRRRDHRRADHPRNLEGSKADAAGSSSDDDEIALGELRLLHQRAPSGDILHRSEEHTSELQSLMRNSYAVFCLKKKTKQTHQKTTHLK